MGKKFVVWFDEVDKNDIPLVGGKGANLGEMVNSNFPIPYGFIITSKAYFYFIEKNKLKDKILSILKNLNYENHHELQQVSSEIKKLIRNAHIPDNLINQIYYYYEHLLAKEEAFFNKKSSSINYALSKIKTIYSPPFVAIRSSATAEDLPNASFAGQQETFLNIKGETHLLEKIKECFASLFNERAIYYRHQQGFSHDKVGLAVVVQKMVNSEKSGIAFSVDPISNDKNKIIIEAIYGLGEYIVQGYVTPDHYEVNKKTFTIIKKEFKNQTIKLVRSGYGNKEVKLGNKGKNQKLSDQEIIKLALLISDIEKHYYFPQDIEWAIEKNRIYITQSRPITTLNNKINQQTIDSNHQLILTGSPASPGIKFGQAVIIKSPKEIDKVKPGNVLVALQTNPDYVPAMRKAVAIVTEKGGRTSHAAIVSRELGIPAVVGAENATKIIKNGQLITVNGNTGEIYSGKVIINNILEKKHKKLLTATKVYVNLAEPHEAEKVSKMNVDGVGLLRAEFMIAEIGIHPKHFIKEKKQHLFINQLSRNLLKFVSNFSPRPVIYRATDFKTNEYRNLTGGKEFEPKEENPMLGFRGAYRYVYNPDVFILELESIKKIWEKGYRNLHLMIPFVRAPWELIKIKSIIEDIGLLRYPDFKLWMMVEIPAVALNLEEFLKIGIEGVSIGTNDLTMLMLGVDRDNPEISNLYDERNPIIIKTLEYIVSTCKKYHVTSSICGQAASDYPEIIEMLIKAGVTSVSVVPDAVERTRELIFNIEKKVYEK